MNETVTYHQQYTKCNKENCRTCRDRQGHGPYWYAYIYKSGRTTRKYIGKQLPPSVQTTEPYTIETSLQHKDTKKQIQDEQQPVVRVFILGWLRIARRYGKHWQSIHDPAWQLRSVRQLLCALLCSPGRRLGKEQAIELLWPDSDIETASNRLHRIIHDLRLVLEPTLKRPSSSRLLRLENGVLSLAPQAEIWVDADAFELLCKTAQTASDSLQKEHLLEKATSLYAGELLPEEHSLEEWILVRRANLQRSWRSALFDLANVSIENGRHVEALQRLNDLLASDPIYESAVQQLMVLLAQMNRRSEALHAYQQFTVVLQRTYEAIPLPRTRQIYESLRQGRVAVDRAAGYTLREKVIGSDETEFLSLVV